MNDPRGMTASPRNPLPNLGTAGCYAAVPMAVVPWWTVALATGSWGSIYQVAHERATQQARAAAEVELWWRRMLPGWN